MSKIEPLTREEQVILLGAQPNIRSEHIVTLESLLDQGVIWRGVSFLAERNKSEALLYRLMKSINPDLVPGQMLLKLRKAYLNTFERNEAFKEIVGRIHSSMTEQAIPHVFVRGLVLAESVYGNPALRRYSDLDLLVERRNVPGALGVLESLGAHLREGSLSDSYYLMYHFHIERQFAEGRRVTVELHWNLDHRYTMFTIDIPRVIQDCPLESVGGIEMPVLHPTDQLLGLCLHAAKHCPAIRYFPDSPLLARRVLLDGWLTQVVDIAMFLGKHRSIDWDRVRHRAQSWGMEPLVYGGLRAASSILGVSNHESAIRLFSPPITRNRLEHELTKRFVDPAYTLQYDRKRGIIEQWILKRWMLQEDAVFHPVRLIDLAYFFSPRKSDLARWYGKANLKPYFLWWIRHALTGVFEISTGAFLLGFHRLSLILRRVVSEKQ